MLDSPHPLLSLLFSSVLSLPWGCLLRAPRKAAAADLRSAPSSHDLLPAPSFQFSLFIIPLERYVLEFLTLAGILSDLWMDPDWLPSSPKPFLEVRKLLTSFPSVPHGIHLCPGQPARTQSLVTVPAFLMPSYPVLLCLPWFGMSKSLAW